MSQINNLKTTKMAHLVAGWLADPGSKLKPWVGKKIEFDRFIVFLRCYIRNPFFVVKREI